MGDFNTFLDREGACYAALASAGGPNFQDIRDAPGVLEVDAGRSNSSWEGWESNAYCRSKKGDQRYDQVFVSSRVIAHRTTVPEERYHIQWQGEPLKVYASDHLPI